MDENELIGVTCVSAAECWAVGYYLDPTTFIDQTLTEHWNGSIWSIVSSPNTSAAPKNTLGAVTCVSASDCWAVGYYLENITAYDRTLIEHWDGTAWAIVSSPNPIVAGLNFLFGVTCASTSECWAVGYADSSNGYQTLIERWDGTSWSIASSPNTSGTQDNYLRGVACTMGSDCWAVVYYQSSRFQTLIQRWDGNAWAIVNSPNATAPDANLFSDVTCVSTSDCWAVGQYLLDNGYQSLIEHWDGQAWTVVESPSTGAGQYNALFGVTCLSASDCWAVGYDYDNDSGTGSSQTLVERWDGTRWTVMASDNAPGMLNNHLLSVTCASRSECWAVGYSQRDNLTNGAFQALIERWDGSSWTVVTLPQDATITHNPLYDVTCVSETECWAVGYYFKGDPVQGGTDRTLIARWDGNAWSVVDSPNTNDTDGNALFGVTCISASECWAVGYYFDGTVQHTLVEHWNGTVWTLVGSPNTSATQANFLFAVSCASASECWAVGNYQAGSYSRNLIEHWDGKAWAIVSSPNRSANLADNFLVNVACVSVSECWALGNSGFRTLALRHTTAAATPTPTATATQTPTPTPAATPTPTSTPPPAQLMNISTRSAVQSGDNVLIGGFIITGNDAKEIVLRAIGPSLRVDGSPVPGRLEDPLIELHDHSGALVAFNDNWKDSAQRTEIESSGLAPDDDRESAILRVLAPGAYTAIVRGKNNGTGIGLVEAYDHRAAADSQMANISTRGFVQTGDNIIIGGFIAGNHTGNTRVLIRAIGPSLAHDGVSNPLNDPRLELHDGNGATMVTNDDWREAENAAKIEERGIAPKDDRESGILASVAPGHYTAIARGKNDGTGVGLVEVYNVP
jgi:hypothetical protein